MWIGKWVDPKKWPVFKSDKQKKKKQKKLYDTNKKNILDEYVMLLYQTSNFLNFDKGGGTCRFPPAHMSNDKKR